MQTLFPCLRFHAAPQTSLLTQEGPCAATCEVFP